MDLYVYQTPAGYEASIDNHTYPCALGKGGIGVKEKEGDGITPLGTWPLRKAFVHPDYTDVFQTNLPVEIIDETTAWCDDPNDIAYNTQVTLPYKASTEKFLEMGHIYAFVAVLGYNDNPVVKGKGSAIFIHAARPNFEPTAGCIAFALDDLKIIAAKLSLNSVIIIDEK